MIFLRMKRLFCSLFLLVVPLGAASAASLELREGDHVCLVGNTLAERMQFEGHNHWETLLHRRFPKLNLVVRNLSWSADELVLRPRAEGFGSPDEHLAFSKADVVIGFFGFNESFKGQAGLEGFKKDLEAWIQRTKEQNYSGKGAARVVLVSPIAAENLHDPNLPDGRVINERLALYVAAMKEVAAKSGVVFADVFTATKKMFEKGEHGPFTINGVHLNSNGDFVFGSILDAALFGAPARTEGQIDDLALTQAVEAKNFHWYHRYRIVDSYYVYGGRSGLKFADGDQTNRDVMEREREVLDVMVANRDERIWKLAQGQPVPEKVDDSNAPAFLEVKTYFGANQKATVDGQRGQSSKTAEGASALIPNVEDTRKQFSVAKGFKIECFASEEDFPELANATSMAFDTKGRLWVCTMRSYPQWRPGDEFVDKIIILEDADQNGRADSCKVFADKLHLPIAFEFFDGGVLVSDQRNLTFLKDTDGDDKADFKEVILSGFDSADSHHVINAFTYGPGGDLYFQEGTFHHSQVETPYGPVRCVNAGTYRFEPRTQRLSVYVSYNYANPHGIAFDRWGQGFIADASGGMNYFATAFSGFLPYPEKHSAMQPFFPKRVRPTSGCEFVSSRNFPEDMQGNFLLNNCIGVQGTLNHTVKAVGSGYEGREVEPLLLSTEPNFRPVDMEFAPDGSLYLVDWSEALIGHMQYSIRDPLRDKDFGRIWRIWNTEKPLLKPAPVAGESVAKLLDLLKEPEYRVRERAKQELSLRDEGEVLAALNDWIARQSDSHALLEGLWMKQYLNKVDVVLLKKVLQDKQPEARAAAVKVLCYWQDRVVETLDLLRAAVNDKHPLVRLEAVRACSFTGLADGTAAGQYRSSENVVKEAAGIALEALKHPMDYYLTYTLGETMRALKPSPADLDLSNPKALAYVLEKMSNEELKAAPRTAAVLAAHLERAGLDVVTREAAALELAKLNGSSREMELISAVMRLDDQQVQTPVYAELGKMLAAGAPEALHTANEKITRMASKDHGVRDARVAGMAAYVAMNRDVASAWKGWAGNHETLSVLLECIGLLPDPALRAQFQPFAVEALESTMPVLVKRPAVAALALTGADHAAGNFALLAKLMLKGEQRQMVAQTAMQLPKTAWDKTQAQALVENILAYAKTVPANQRTRQDYVEISRFGSELCALLPEGTGPAMRKALRELGVSVFVIKTLREQMRYDTAELVVEAGKPFEVIFENNDIMPHNVVFVLPGKHVEVGSAAQTMPAKPDAKGYLYVPPHPAVLPKAYTHMLEPGQKERLQVTAPKESGEYEFVCTFPGHWMIMWGKLVVSQDVDAYLSGKATAGR